MLTFLKQLGLDIAKGIEILTGVAPFLTSLQPKAAPIVGTVESDLNQLLAIVVQVEATSATLTTPMAGVDKMNAVAAQLAQIFLKVEGLAGKPQKDPTLFTNGTQQVASGLANILNSFHAQPSGAPPVVPPTAPITAP